MSTELKASLIVILSAVALILFGVWLSKITCSKQWVSFDTKWTVWAGCQLDIDGKLIPAESYYFKEE